MRVSAELLPGALLIELQAFADDRGSFSETYNRAKLAGLGVDLEFVQDNESVSLRAGTVRGLHLQLAPHAQGKMVRALRGSIFDVAVDLRPDSPTYLQHAAVTLTEADALVFWIPPGFAHGFCTLEANTVVAYKTTALYAPEADRSIRFDDPRLAIAWPVQRPHATLSAKDAAAPGLDAIEHEL